MAITVRVDNNLVETDPNLVRTMGDLVETIKSNLSPETIISSIKLSGKDLTENDWRTPIAVQQQSTIEFSTCGKFEYLADRLALAPIHLDELMKDFTNAKDNFRTGDTKSANKLFAGGVTGLKAFFEWYLSILELTGNDRERGNFESELQTTLNSCELMLQQQLYNSWWALGETVDKKLVPSLERLKGICLKLFGEHERNQIAKS